MTTPYQYQGVWPDVESMVFAWLKPNLSGVNVAKETDTTFGTSSPSALMALPLVLVERVPGGRVDPEHVTETAAVDISCFAKDRQSAWNLYAQVNDWMLRSITQTTPVGTFDDVIELNPAGLVNYNNPNLRRVIVTYGISARAEATA